MIAGRWRQPQSTRSFERFGPGRALPGMKVSRSWLPSAGLLVAVLAWSSPVWSTTAAAGSGRVAAKPVPRDTYDGPPLLLGDGRRKIKIGAYGGMGGAYTRLADRHSGLVSVEGALLLDHRLSLGAAGYGFTRTPTGPDASDGTPQEFGAGYGGFVARYAVFGRLPVYSSFGLLLGAGAVNLHHDHGLDEDEWDDGFESNNGEWDHGRFDPFLVVQPELMLHANVTRWLRFGAVLGYRLTGGVGRFGLEESDLNGIVAGANVQLGWF